MNPNGERYGPIALKDTELQLIRVQLRQTYNVVAALSAQSGFHWDDEHGADINEDSEAVWQAYVQV